MLLPGISTQPASALNASSDRQNNIYAKIHAATPADRVMFGVGKHKYAVNNEDLDRIERIVGRKLNSRWILETRREVELTDTEAKRVHANRVFLGVSCPLGKEKAEIARMEKLGIVIAS